MAVTEELTWQADRRQSARPVQTDPAPRRASWRARWTARMSAGRLDAALAVGARATPGSALAVRAARLTTRRERDALARDLARAVRAAHDATAWLALRDPLNRSNIVAAEAVIDAVIERLAAAQPVDVRGVARVRRVLADGHGPYYRFGRGDLAGRLRAALAAM